MYNSDEELILMKNNIQFLVKIPHSKVEKRQGPRIRADISILSNKTEVTLFLFLALSIHNGMHFILIPRQT